MSKFRNLIESILLDAKQVGNLYHATNFEGLESIIKSNSLKSNRPNGISFSRNKHCWYGFHPFCLVLDGDKLSNNNKLYPFSYFNVDPEYFKYKDGNSEISLLPRGQKASKISDDELFCTTTYTLPNLDKYLKELLINTFILDNYTQFTDAPEDISQERLNTTLNTFNNILTVQ